MKKYFEVVAKCGHVGKNQYYEGHFFLLAESESRAAHSVKGMPRVKRDHEDAILCVNEITYEEYASGREEMSSNPYFNCRSKHEQNAVMDRIIDGIRPETERQIAYRESHGYSDRKEKPKSKKNGIRNPYKYAKYNMVNDWDYEYIGA